MILALAHDKVPRSSENFERAQKGVLPLVEAFESCPRFGTTDSISSTDIEVSITYLLVNLKLKSDTANILSKEIIRAEGDSVDCQKITKKI